MTSNEPGGELGDDPGRSDAADGRGGAMSVNHRARAPLTMAKGPMPR